MTVASQVKTCVASLKSAQASLEQFALETQNQGAKALYTSAAQQTMSILQQVEGRVSKIESEEPQYKGFFSFSGICYGRVESSWHKINVNETLVIATAYTLLMVDASCVIAYGSLAVFAYPICMVLELLAYCAIASTNFVIFLLKKSYPPGDFLTTWRITM